MITATPENTFIGSVVVKKTKSKEERFNVYKVNKNFVWAGRAPSYFISRQWEHKEKGETWNKIMTEHEAKKLNFGNLLLDETKTENVVEKKDLSKKKEKQKKGKYVNACCIKRMKKTFVLYKEQKNYRYYVDCSCGNTFFPLQGYEDNTLIFSLGTKQLKLNYDTEEVTLHKDITA